MDIRSESVNQICKDVFLYIHFVYLNTVTRIISRSLVIYMFILIIRCEGITDILQLSILNLIMGIR